MELRRTRLDADLTQEKVADAMDWSLSKLIRIGNGSVSISTNDLKAILQYYNISDEDRVAQLLTLSRAARRRSPWTRFAAAASKQLIENVTIEIVPFDAGLWSGTEQPFVIHGMSDAPDDYVLDLENPRGDQFPDEVSSLDEIARFLAAFDRLRESSLGPEKTVAFLRQLVDELN